MNGMVPLGTMEGVYARLLTTFTAYGPDGTQGNLRKVRMVGLLLAPLGAPLVNDEIIPRLAYYHHRSGNNVDFFCGGYLDQAWQFRNAREVCNIDGRKWYYSDAAFNAFREDLESQATWKFSGELDLMLLNARLESHMVKLEFSKALVVNLAKAKRDGAFSSVSAFFEDIFRYAERQSGNDPTWGFSDAQGVRLGGSCFVELLLLLVPPPLRNLWRRGRNFAVINAAPAT